MNLDWGKISILDRISRECSHKDLKIEGENYTGIGKNVLSRPNTKFKDPKAGHTYLTYSKRSKVVVNVG